MRHRKTLLAAPLALIVALAVAIAGCGGSSDNVKASAPAASATPASSQSGGAASIGSRSGNIGTFLVDSQGRTLYLFEKDTGSMSTCSGACATEWPPARTKGSPKAGSGVDAAKLGTTKRSDGVTQVTYAGHPLYRYLGDTAPGDTNGEGLEDFGGGWDVIAPSGKKIEGDQSEASSSQTSSGW